MLYFKHQFLAFSVGRLAVPGTAKVTLELLWVVSCVLNSQCIMSMLLKVDHQGSSPIASDPIHRLCIMPVAMASGSSAPRGVLDVAHAETSVCAGCICCHCVLPVMCLTCWIALRGCFGTPHPSAPSTYFGLAWLDSSTVDSCATHRLRVHLLWL
jgi:hypothetical protein